MPTPLQLLMPTKPEFFSPIFCPIFCPTSLSDFESDLFICTIFLFRFSVGFICLFFLFDFHVRSFCPTYSCRFICPIFCPVSCPIFARYFCPTCSCPNFFWVFDPISCPIFVRFSMSDFLCPIFLSEFFVRLVHVRFFLSDSFILFLSDLFYPTCLCPIFCPLFLADLLSHFLCDFWSKKMEHVSSCNATFVMYYQYVSVFIIMTVSYTRMGVI